MASLVAHEAVLAAVEQGDSRGAGRAMRAHLAHMEPQFLAPELAASWPDPDPDTATRKLFNILD